MNIKYYDLLSKVIVGILIVAFIDYNFLGNIEIDGIVYLAFGYFVGYVVNAIGSLLEPFYFTLACGHPSDRLLTIKKEKKWTGWRRVKFYEAETVIMMLKGQMQKRGIDESIESKDGKKIMFDLAKNGVFKVERSRVPSFNAQYAFSRTILTAVIIVFISSVVSYYDELMFWLISIVLLLISFFRFKGRSYYYAREVLIEYINLQPNSSQKE